MPRHVANHTRHRGACINCRQQKARCDAYDKLPSACSRCDKAGRECVLDRSFKRSARKDRLDQLEKELRELRSNIRETSATRASSVDPDSDTAIQGESPPAQRHGARIQTIMGPIEVGAPPTSLSKHQLEGVVLEPPEIMEHVDIFYRYYHEALPILPSKDILLQHLPSCQLLLWAIVVITASQTKSRRHLEVDLVDAIRRLVATEFLVSEAASILQIQALLLLAFWPMPFKATIQDPSWIYSNMALSKALRIGLHRSSGFFQSMYGAQGGDKIRLRTWVACFIIAQLYAAALGLPATVRPDNIILRCVAERPHDLPSVLHRMLLVAYKVHVFTGQLGDYQFTSDGLMPDPLPIVRTFDSDLRTLPTEPGQEMVLNLMARLCLYSFVLAASTAPEEATRYTPAVQSHDGVYYITQTYNCAKQIIDLFSAEFNGRAKDGPSTGARNPRFWNCFQRWSILYATMTILWIIKLSGIDNNTASAQAVVVTGRNVIKKLILTEEDHYARVCDIIDYISSMDPSSSEGRNMSRSVVRARASVNLIWDVVYAAKQRYTEQRVAAKDHPAQDSNKDMPSNAQNATPTPTAEAMSDAANSQFDTMFTDWDGFIPDLDLLDMDMPSPRLQ